MAYGNRFGGGGYRGGGGGGFRRSGGRSAGTSVRLTGLFPTRKPGLLTGTIDGEQLDGLIAKIKAAKAAGQGIVVFCWENDRPQQGRNAPAFNLSADVSKPKDDEGPAPAPRRAAAPARPARRRIEEPDPIEEAEEGSPEANDDPFA